MLLDGGFETPHKLCSITPGPAASITALYVGAYITSACEAVITMAYCLHLYPRPCTGHGYISVLLRLYAVHVWTMGTPVLSQ